MIDAFDQLLERHAERANQALGDGGDGAPGRRTSFYVPRFQIWLQDREAPDLLLHDVIDVTVQDSIKDLSGFAFTLHNEYDARASRFKYDGSPLLALGNKVRISMGYGEDPELMTMIIGEINGLSPQFPASGAPTLSVTGLDRLHRMRNDPKSKSWKGKTDRDIAAEIAAENALSGVFAEDTGIRYESVLQTNKDDLAFLLERAKRINFEVYVRNDVLYFVKPRDTRQPRVTLRWGRSLASFGPRMSLGKQPSRATVRGFHLAEGRPIVETAERSALRELALGEPSGADVLYRALGGDQEEVIASEVVRSDEEARVLARATLTRTSHAFVTAEAATVGIPALRAGTTVGIDGLGDWFSGSYYITESRHAIGAGGYTTTLSVRKVSQ